MPMKVCYCDECGGRLALYVVGICPQCSFGATGEDPERDEHERRSDNATDGEE